MKLTFPCRRLIHAVFTGLMLLTVVRPSLAGTDHNGAVTSGKSAGTPAVERSFQWTRDRKLTWNDFRGPVRMAAGDRTVAETACGIGFETNEVRAGIKPKFFVYNTFETTTSWVKAEDATPEVLQHEQSHFDICELYTRKLRERFSKASVNVHNMQTVIRNIYEATEREYAARQQRYEDETRHGIIGREQQRWTDMINRELTETEQWMTN